MIENTLKYSIYKYLSTVLFIAIVLYNTQSGLNECYNTAVKVHSISY